MRSTRTSLAVLCVVVGVAAGCGSDDHQAHGSALVGHGPQLSSQITIDAPDSGNVYYLGFPALENRSGSTVRIVGYGLASRSSTIKVLRYVVYSPSQFGGRTLLTYDPEHPERSFNFAGARSLPLQYRIPAGHASSRFAMVEIRVAAYPPSASIKGCKVFYTMGAVHQKYEQQFACDFRVGTQPTSLGHHVERVLIINSNSKTTQIFGCPVCRSHGVGLPGVPNAKVGEGGSVGWKVAENATLVYPVQIGNRHFSCRPPRAVTNASGHRTVPTELHYDITPQGTCIVLRDAGGG